MKYLINSVLLFIAIILINSCSDSLGINGADYLKSASGADTMRIDTMINFKKVIIEKIITKTDTIYKTINVPIIYDPVKANKIEFHISEIFSTGGSKETINLIKFEKAEHESILNYNPLTPEIKLKDFVTLPLDSNNNGFAKRSEKLIEFSLEFDKLPAVSDQPFEVKKLLESGDLRLKVKTMLKNYSIKTVDNNLLSGSFGFLNRQIIDGQLRSIHFSGLIFFPKEYGGMKDYTLEISVKILYPAI